jgi:hypothetical protein
MTPVASRVSPNMQTITGKQCSVNRSQDIDPDSNTIGDNSPSRKWMPNLDLRDARMLASKPPVGTSTRSVVTPKMSNPRTTIHVGTGYLQAGFPYGMGNAILSRSPPMDGSMRRGGPPITRAASSCQLPSLPKRCAPSEPVIRSHVSILSTGSRHGQPYDFP